MKYVKFTTLSKLLMLAFCTLIVIGSYLGEITGIIGGILGIISILIGALFTRMYDLSQLENWRLRKIIAYLQQYTGIWN